MSSSSQAAHQQHASLLLNNLNKVRCTSLTKGNKPFWLRAREGRTRTSNRKRVGASPTCKRKPETGGKALGGGGNLGPAGTTPSRKGHHPTNPTVRTLRIKGP